jgi:uncharacterized protein YxeA
MKKIVTMLVAALMALSFSMVAVAEEKKDEKAADAKVEKKDAKKDKKKDDKKKDADAKPAAKGKKEVSGC